MGNRSWVTGRNAISYIRSPITGCLAYVCMIFIVLIFCCALPDMPSRAEERGPRKVDKLIVAERNAAEDEKGYCLKCHGEKGSVKKFPDGDFIPTYIDSQAFTMSVHRSLRCTACHKEFSLQRHPERSFRNKLQYRIKESHVCRDCHKEGTIRSEAIHESLFRKEKAGEAVVCTNCHSAHAGTPVIGGNASAAEEKYCLGCHSKEKKMVFNSKEFVSVRVNAGELRNSPHKDVGCSDCHFGFSAENHPHRRFRYEREYRISSAEMCRRCHFDKYSKVSESIHYNMLSAGRLEAPTCIDCHGGHAVSSLGNNRSLAVAKCRKCHGDVYEVYARSVHGKALFNENNRDVPICIDCHSSHGIKNPFSPGFHDYIPETCGKCHSNATLMGKYGLSTDVVKTYLSDFHGMTLGLQRKDTQKGYRPEPPMAVCTDCHGTHDISGILGADVHVVKNKLLKRCQKCHSNATSNFPDAWLSHYKPSLKVAPLVFIVEQFYKIIMPLMVAGLLFQILLNIWRYLANR
jgi:predicted CXXCH cytochrome family protein